MAAVVDPAVWRGRRALRLGLALLWLTAGALQFQPDMFTPDFYGNYPGNIMESFFQGVADGQPTWLAHTIMWGSGLWGKDPILWNLLAASLQCFIGLALGLVRNERFVRFVLFVSIGWGLVVWVFGEAFGSLFSIDDLGYFGGTPGAVSIYVVGAALLLVPLSWWQSGAVAQSIRYGFAGLWLLWAVIQAAKPGDWTSSNDMSAYANAGALQQPDWLAAPINQYALWVAGHTALANLVLVVGMAMIGLAFMIFEWNAWLLWFSLWWMGWTWWFVEDFGGLFSGFATDLNVAPAIAVFIVSGYMMRHVRKEADPLCLLPLSEPR